MPDAPTPLDTAHDAMLAAPEDDALRLRFYERLAASELFVLLEAEAKGDRVDPMIFPIEGQSYVLVFDREERLAAFMGEPVPYVALSGRRLAETMAGQNLGMGVNLSVAPSSILIPAAAVDWLAETLAHRPTEIEARPEAIDVPGGMPESLLGLLDARLASAAGLARSAYLVAVRYAGNRPGHLLAFVDARPGAEAALAQAASEALTFSGIDAARIDVAFFDSSDPICRRLARVGLRFDLPEPPEPATPAAPGSDPDRPPRLR